LKERWTVYSHHITFLIALIINSLSQKAKLVLQWIPAHFVIPGNEKADELAKEGGNLPQTHPPLTFKETAAFLKYYRKK
jgi:ribonuclease HI